MKKMLITATSLATLLSASAMAGDHAINAIGRTSWTYKDNDTKKTNVSNSSSFNFDYLKTTFSGAMSPTVKYFLATNLLTANGATDAVDGTSDFVDEAFISNSFEQGTTISLGKKVVSVGGREYDYYNYDRYTNSYFFNATPYNQVGLTVSHDIANQTFTAQYFNGNKTNGTAANAQSKFGYSAIWYGNIAEGLVKPIVGYTVIPEAAGAVSTEGSTARVNRGDDTFLSAGLQLSLPNGLIIEADYDILTEKDATGTVTAAKDLKTTSIVGQVKYNTDNLSPFAKVISDTSKTDSTKTGSRFAYDLGVEYKKLKDDMYRFHLVYSGSTVKTGINTTEVKSSPKAIMAGVKFDAAILK